MSKNTDKQKTVNEGTLINELGRKSIHLVVIVFPVSYHFLKLDLWIIQLGLFFALVFFIPVEVYRLKIHQGFFINRLMREREQQGLGNYIYTTTAWLLLVLGATFYGFELAEFVIVTTHLGDAIAAVIGKAIGRHRLIFTSDKTVEGFVSGISFSLLCGLLLVIIFSVNCPLWWLVVPPTVVGLVDFLENLPEWASDNIFNPMGTLLIVLLIQSFV